MLNGIADVDIRREALSVNGIQRQSINDIIGFVEGREIARNANPILEISAVSGYKRNQRGKNSNDNGGTPSNDNGGGQSAANRAKTAPCPDCQQPFHLFSRGARGWNKRPHDRCQACWKRNRDRQQTNGNASAISASTSCDPFGQISSITMAMNTEQPDEYDVVDKVAKLLQPHHQHRRRTRRQAPNIGTMDHHIFNKGEWRRARLADHPRVKLSIAPNRAHAKPTCVDGIADSGAQSNVWSLADYLKAGYLKEDLSPVSLSLNAANKSPIKIDGAFFSEIRGINTDGSVITCKAMIYVSRNVSRFFLSYATMIDLGMLPKNF